MSAPDKQDVHAALTWVDMVPNNRPFAWHSERIAETLADNSRDVARRLRAIHLCAIKGECEDLPSQIARLAEQLDPQEAKP